MTNAEAQANALQAIVRIVREQKALEKHQRSTKASFSTLQDSMVYAYDQIVKVVRPFMTDQN